MITQDLLKELLQYNPETGLFTWRKRDLSHFKSVGSMRSWNTRFANKEAGQTDSDGYRQINLFYTNHRAHRLAFLYLTGEFPPIHVDHINGNRRDNRWVNIGAVCRQENQMNMAMRSDNTSGSSGVCWDRWAGKWKAYIFVDGKNKNLGRYSKKEDAIEARKSAEFTYGYHPNHGRTQ